MSITKQDIKRMIKEELKKVLVEDLSLLRDMTPGDVLEYMRRELNGKTWFFWDLESIGFDGQITQYGAIAFKIDDLWINYKILESGIEILLSKPLTHANVFLYLTWWSVSTHIVDNFHATYWSGNGMNFHRSII